MSDILNILDQLKEQYLTILVVISIVPSMYAIVFSTREKDERGYKIMNTAYQFTYFFFIFSIFILFIINRIFDMSFVDFRSGIITIFLIANFFLGIILFTLNKRY